MSSHASESPGPAANGFAMEPEEGAFISRTQKQMTTQQVTTTTKTIREVQYLGPDGQPLDFVPSSSHSLDALGPPPLHPRLPNGLVYDYEEYANMNNADNDLGSPMYANYGANVYPHRPPTPPSPSERSQSPPPEHNQPDYLRRASASQYVARSGYDELDTTLMPPRHGEPFVVNSDGGPPPRPKPRLSSSGSTTLNNGDTMRVEDMDNSVFEDESRQMQPQPEGQVNPRVSRTESRDGVQWRDPDLSEVVAFLSNSNAVIRSNAAAYLQHLCFMDDPVKTRTRQLNGIPVLVSMLANDNEKVEVQRNACGALRNLSYGRQNDENKRAIRNAGGIRALVDVLAKARGGEELCELATGVIWNLSSCDDLKRAILDEALVALVTLVIIPHSGFDPNNGPGKETVWSNVLRNASGILRNVSSAGDYGRKRLRECGGLPDSLFHVVRRAIANANIDSKSVENCVCVLRNLSFRAQEIEDPNYDKRSLETRAAASNGTEKNLGCFGAKAANKNAKGVNGNVANNTYGANGASRTGRTGPVRGMELLWQPEVVPLYLNLLSNCSNPETLEASAGALQNLSACYWQPSIDMRAAVRKEKGLPILVELLRMQVDRVVCAVATALRNLAIDPKNKELIGKYAMRDLVQKLPSGDVAHDQATSDDTVAAVLATLNEVIKRHPEFARALLEAEGVDRLVVIVRHRQRFSSRVVKFASQVLFSMWLHTELREVYKKAGWREHDFVSKNVSSRSNLNSTLNRPMASQSGTRYEDRTLPRQQVQRQPHQPQQMAYPADAMGLQNLSLYGHVGANQPTALVYNNAGHQVMGGEPVYAQVNRDRKKSALDDSNYGDHWQLMQQWHADNNNQQQQSRHGGDSWV